MDLSDDWRLLDNGGDSYFCKYDELCIPSRICPGIELTCAANSCCGPDYKDQFKERFGIDLDAI